MQFRKHLAGTIGVAGLMSAAFLLQMPAGQAADAKAPNLEQRAIDNASPARVDAQIKELHDKLRVTPAEENLWKDVAEAMRDTAKEVRTKLGEREEKEKSGPVTAVVELREYRDLQQVQYDGVKRLLDPFDKLYDAMSADQKKNADEIFERPREEAAAAGGSAHHHHMGHAAKDS